MSFAPTCTNIGAILVLNKTEPEDQAVYLHNTVESKFYDAQDDMLTHDIDDLVHTLHQQKPSPKPPRVYPAVAFSSFHGGRGVKVV